MKKGFILMTGMLLLLSGCGSHETKQHASSKASEKQIETAKKKEQTAQSSKKESQTKQKSTSSNEKGHSSNKKGANTTNKTAIASSQESSWDATKSDQLANFMSAWGKAMGQTYKSYTNQSPVDLYGVALPQAILNGEWKMVVGEQPQSVSWSSSGKGTADFDLVAVYSDVENTQGIKPRHVYFFGFQQGQPKTYVTQQNQGNENKHLYFEETGNKALKEGFATIAQGGAPDTDFTGDPSASSSEEAGSGTAASSSAPADPLAGYTDDQIEYARVWLTVMGTQYKSQLSSPGFMLFASHAPAGAKVNPYDESSLTYPRDTVTLSGAYGYQSLVVYTSNHNGTITKYSVPSHFQSPNVTAQDKANLKNEEQAILDSGTVVAIPTGNPEDVKELIHLLQIID